MRVCKGLASLTIAVVSCQNMVSVPHCKASINRGCAISIIVLTLLTFRAPTAAVLAISCRTSIRRTSGKFAQPLYLPAARMLCEEPGRARADSYHEFWNQRNLGAYTLVTYPIRSSR
jgi:hypothetical protein